MSKELRERYEKETNQSAYDMPEHYHGNGEYSNEYVKYIEAKLEEAEEIEKAKHEIQVMFLKSSREDNVLLRGKLKEAEEENKELKRKLKEKRTACRCGHPYSEKDLQDGMCNKCCAPTTEF